MANEKLTLPLEVAYGELIHAFCNGASFQKYLQSYIACCILTLNSAPEPCLSLKTIFPRYGDSRDKDKTVVSASYL